MTTKISILLFAVMMASSLSAQIEEVSAEQYAPKKEVQKGSPLEQLKIEEYPIFLGKYKYNLLGHQLYCTTNLHVVACQLPDGTMHTKRLSQGSYYDVVDILWPEQIEANCQIIKKNKKLARDTIHYTLSYSNKERIWKSGSEDVLSLMRTKSFVYVLQNKAGEKYYVRWEYDGNHNPMNEDYIYDVRDRDNRVIFHSAAIGDFISVKTYTHLKENQEESKYVSWEYIQFQEKENYVWTVKKVGIDKGNIVFVMKNDKTEETRINPFRRIREREGVKLKEDINWIETFTRYDTISALQLVDPRNDLYFDQPKDKTEYGDQYYLKSEVDSILGKFHKEKAALIKQREENDIAIKQKRVDKYGSKFAKCIEERKVCVGMTKEMCKEAKGSPDNTTKSSSNLGVVEVWTYTMDHEIWGGLEPIVVVTFVNGKVTSVDEYKDNYPF